MEIFINPLRQLAIWRSPLYDGYSECIQLNKDLSYKKTVFELEGSTQEALLHGVREDKVTHRGWVRLHVERVNSWEDVWPEAMKGTPLNEELKESK